jgi:cyclopropane fatty-acyl-phospholipid synthase-like methyltransferase
MSSDQVFEYKGYQIPTRLMQLTGGGPENFDAVSRVHMDLIERHVGLFPDMKVVEIGCGIGRDAIPLTERLSDRGSGNVTLDVVGC